MSIKFKFILQSFWPRRNSTLFGLAEFSAEIVVLHPDGVVTYVKRRKTAIKKRRPKPSPYKGFGN